MKKISLSLCAIYLCLHSLPSLANNDICHTNPGQLICNNGEIKTLPSGIYGSIELKRINITGATRLVTGNLSGEFCSLNNAEIVAGRIDFSNCKIKGKKINLIAGRINLKNYTAKNKMTVYSPNISLNNASTQSLQIKSKEKTQLLYLKLTGNTVVNGNITFSNNQGVVCIDNYAKIRGKITGGVIKHDNCINQNMT